MVFFIVLLVAGIILYLVFSKPSATHGESAEDDDMLTYDPFRAATDDPYAQYWGTKNGLDD